MVDLIILSGICNDVAAFDYLDNPNMHLPYRLLGPYKVADRARQAGYKVQIIDFVQYMDSDVLVDLIKRYINPKTILAINTNHIIATHFNFKDPVYQKIIPVLDLFGNKRLVGGYNAAACKDAFSADYVVTGYSENSIVDFLNSHLNNGISKKLITPWDITTCNFNFHSDDRIVTGETLPLEIGRGCIFKCKFCRFENLGKKRGTYVRDMELIKDQLISNFETKQITNYIIIDDTFNDDVYKLEQWAKITSELPFKIRFSAHIRADLLDKHPESVHLLKESGIKAANMGIESFHPKASSVIGKSWSGKRARNFIPALIESSWSNINITTNFIIGLPYETYDSMYLTYKWVMQNKVSAQFFRLTVSSMLPNQQTMSLFDKEPEKYGIKFDDRGMWYHQTCDKVKASKMTHHFNKMVSKSTPLNCWETFNMLNYGYDFDYIMSMPKKTFLENTDLKTRMSAFINQYICSFDKQ